MMHGLKPVPFTLKPVPSSQNHEPFNLTLCSCWPRRPFLEQALELAHFASVESVVDGTGRLKSCPDTKLPSWDSLYPRSPSARDLGHPAQERRSRRSFGRQNAIFRRGDSLAFVSRWYARILAHNA